MSILKGRKLIHLGLGIGLSVVLLCLALRGTDFAHIAHSLKRTELTQVALAVLFLLLSLWLRAWRWRYLLLSLKPLSVMLLFRATLIGFMGNYLLPFRMGELMRAVSLGQTQKISKSSALGSILLERVLDGLTLSIIPFLTIAILDLPPWIVQLNGLLFFIYVIGVTITIGGPRGRTVIWLERVFSMFPPRLGSRLSWTADLFFQGANGLSKGRSLLPVTLLSVLCWLLHGMYYYCLFEAFNLNLSFSIALILQAVIGLGVMLPAGPGYVGNFEYATVFGLSLVGIDRGEAFAYSILAHSCQFFPIVSAGCFFAFKGGFGEWRQS